MNYSNVKMYYSKSDRFGSWHTLYHRFLILFDKFISNMEKHKYKKHKHTNTHGKLQEIFTISNNAKKRERHVNI